VLLSQKKEGRVFGLGGGAQLAEFAPNSFDNHGLAVSADGRFIAVPSFTAEVKVRGRGLPKFSVKRELQIIVKYRLGLCFYRLAASQQRLTHACGLI
jgi:hypothetical protein